MFFHTEFSTCNAESWFVLINFKFYCHHFQSFFKFDNLLFFYHCKDTASREQNHQNLILDVMPRRCLSSVKIQNRKYGMSVIVRYRPLLSVREGSVCRLFRIAESRTVHFGAGRERNGKIRKWRRKIFFYLDEIRHPRNEQFLASERMTTLSEKTATRQGEKKTAVEWFM